MARRIEGAVLPSSCILCGIACADSPVDLCRGCVGDLPRIALGCARCGLPLESAEPACGRCLRRTPPFDASRIPFRYDWPLDGLVTRFKFRGDLAAGRVLAERFVEATRDAPPQVDCLVAVPLAVRRLRERGFNQSLEVARRWSEAFGVPLERDALVRSRETVAQSGLDAKSRHRNVRGAFEVTRRVDGESIALVDDVVTTGATATACAAALKRAGAKRIEVWALARAPGPSAGRT